MSFSASYSVNCNQEVVFTVTAHIASLSSIEQYTVNIDYGDNTFTGSVTNTINLTSTNTVIVSFNHYYNTPGVYTATISGYVCGTLLATPITVSVNVTPDIVYCPKVCNVTYTNNCNTLSASGEIHHVLNPSAVNYTVDMGDGQVYAGNMASSSAFYQDATQPGLYYLSLTYIYNTTGTYTVTFLLNGPSVASVVACNITLTTVVNVSCTACPSASISHTALNNSNGCTKFEFNTGMAGYAGTLPISYSYGDGTNVTSTITPTGDAVAYEYGAPGTYTFVATIVGPGTCVATASDVVTVTCTPVPCQDCISSFAPEPGKRYLISAWVKEASAPLSQTNYSSPSILINFSPSGSAGPFSTTGNIIDGWQKIEGDFVIPINATDIGLVFYCSTGDCYFDDIRFQPYESSMKSFVYDPINLRFIAELDERNYATIFEYDEEGKRIRLKKETERGIMTIQENRNFNPKK